ncbi:MAG: hydrogenase HycQ [Candidatus Xenobia bacterium]
MDLLIALPALTAALAFMTRRPGLLFALLLGTALIHLGLTCWLLGQPLAPPSAEWIQLDATGAMFLGITSLLFLMGAIYAVGYLKREEAGARTDLIEGLLFKNAPLSMFVGCLLAFLASMTLVCLSHHLNLLWIAVEATTLASAPLIYFHRHHRSLEATWKYLLVCSVGIGLALLGNLFLVVAGSTVSELASSPLQLSALVARARQLDVPWLKLAFVLQLVGYGTKMGLAPLHTWLPDTHSESPSVVSALLSGTLLNCAFLAILRSCQITEAAGIGAYSGGMLVTLGLVSLGVAALFILNTRDFKRMLAYSSVEHMGILALGTGLGGLARFGAMLHAVNHSLVKATLFLVAGNLMHAYHTRTIARVRGLTRWLPASGALWLGGFLALSGSPPFGPFMSELIIFRGALQDGRFVVAGLFAATLALVFIGMSRAVLGMAQGAPPERPPQSEPGWSVLPPLLLLSLSLVLGVYLPEPLAQLLRGAAGQ